MPFQYPDSWSELAHPQMRMVLLDELLSVSGIGGQLPSDKPTFAIDDFVHLIFDDTDLFPNTDHELGLTLLNADEVSSVRNVGQILDSIISDLGNECDQEFVAHARWSEFVSSCVTLHKLLLRNGGAEFVE